MSKGRCFGLGLPLSRGTIPLGSISARRTSAKGPRTCVPYETFLDGKTMRKIEALPLIIGLIGSTVLAIFPSWNVKYSNVAGLDRYVLKSGTIQRTYQDEGITSWNVTAKRGFLFGGPPKVGHEIARTAPKPEDFKHYQINTDANGTQQWDCPWQIVSDVSGVPNYKRMFIEMTVIIFLSVAWFWMFRIFLRKRS